MNKGAKIFLALAGIGGAIGTVLLFSSKSAHAAPLPAKPDEEPKPDDVVVVPPVDTPEPPVVVPAPAPEPTIDTAEASRLLLRWWSAEGESLLFSEEDREQLRSRGFPVNFGTEPNDLGASWGPRKVDMAAAFERLSGLSPDDGAPTQKLFDALVRWAKSQELPPPIVPSSPSEPAPQIIQAPGEEPIVVAPEPTPPQQQVIPVPVPIAAPPPFVPPSPPAPVAPPMVVQQPAPPIAVPVALPPAPVPAPAPVTMPTVLAAERPSSVPADTAALVAELLAAEASAGWKKISGAVTAWQKSRGLKQDGKFGPKSALMVASEIGTVPIVRYWPSGTLPNKAVPEYRAKLLELAAAAPEPRASQLRISAQREEGQGFGSNQTALPASQRVQIAQVA